MPRPLAFLTAAILLVTIPLLVYFVVGEWNDYQHSSSVAYYNTTDELLCASSPPSCGAEIKPHATSYWAEDCNSAPIAQVVVYTQDGRQLYARRADCEDWTGEFVVINKRNGEFTVTDSLPSDPIRIDSNWTIGDALQFDGFPLLWLGDSYKGREGLTAINMANNVVGFVYGESTCNDTDCSAPIWVTVESYCENSPQKVASLLAEFVRFGLVVTDVEIRGAKGLYVTGWKEPRLYLWIGASAVQIKSNKPEISIQEAAQDLVPITTDPDNFPTPEALPPPISTSC